MFDKGDIVLIPFPYSNLTGSKRRPAMVISNSNLKGGDEICCLITSNNPKDGVLISRGSFSEGKLPFKSWVKPHRIFTVDEKIVIRKLARVGEDFCGLIREKVDYFIG